MPSAQALHEEVLGHCREALPGWASLGVEDFDFEDPKGFSSFTMSIRARVPAEPSAVLYRRLEGKENAILDFDGERQLVTRLGEHRLAARCYAYTREYRIEEFYEGRTLGRDDLRDRNILSGIGEQLHRYHALEPTELPDKPFFELLHERWGIMASEVLANASIFPANEQVMCTELGALLEPATLDRVRSFLPSGEPEFAHNDVYHGNVMLLDDGRIKLLDFEFSCLNHRAFDFSNLFSETVSRHKLPEYPYFAFAEPEYSVADIEFLVDAYLSHQDLGAEERVRAGARLVAQVQRMLPLSDFMYAMAALPLAVDPIQKIRFIPYAHQRFGRFMRAKVRPGSVADARQ